MVVVVSYTQNRKLPLYRLYSANISQQVLCGAPSDTTRQLGNLIYTDRSVAQPVWVYMIVFFVCQVKYFCDGIAIRVCVTAQPQMGLAKVERRARLYIYCWQHTVPTIVSGISSVRLIKLQQSLVMKWVYYLGVHVCLFCIFNACIEF